MASRFPSNRTEIHRSLGRCSHNRRASTLVIRCRAADKVRPFRLNALLVEEAECQQQVR